MLLNFPKKTIIWMVGIFCPIIVYAQLSSTRYNVIMICIDDMNNHVSFLGYPEPNSPNLDRLAAHGMVFYYNHCQYPLCSPSRTSLLSGWRPDKTNIFDNNTRPRSLIA